MNIVFVGYEPTLVSQSDFLAALPQTYKPIVRSRFPYGVIEELGLSYQFSYNVTFTSTTWENSLFAALSSLAAGAANAVSGSVRLPQIKNVLDVGANHFIDAPSVEKWLIDNAPAGVDTRRNTIFFINWWGRPDFRFHVYTKFGSPILTPATTSGSTVSRARSSRGAARRRTTRKPGLAFEVNGACGSTTFRPGPNRGRTTGTWTTPT